MGVCVIEQQIAIVATHHRIQCTDEAIKTNGYNRARYYTLHNITNDLLKQSNNFVINTSTICSAKTLKNLYHFQGGVKIRYFVLRK